jgi:ABC-type transport system involved in cytochrome c biogenesis permease subunit
MPELALLWIASFFYLAAACVVVLSPGRGDRGHRAVIALLATGLALHAASLGLRWERLGTGPFITMFEILASNVWSLTLLYAFAYWRWPAVRPGAVVVLPIVLVMALWMLSSDPAAGHQPATYRTLWLWVHVGFGKVFLGAVLVAVGLSGVILLRGLPAAAPRFARLPGDARLEALAFRFLVVAFLFESLMLVAGAIWAQDAWGRYWAWDPLETWAFLTWLALAAFIHARSAFRVAPAAGAAMVIAVFAIAFLTFFGVPFVSTAPHKGAI